MQTNYKGVIISIAFCILIILYPSELQVRLKCSAEGSPRPGIAWFKDGLPLESRPGAKHRARDETFSLKISKLSPPDEGNYTCVVTNDYGQIREVYHKIWSIISICVSWL